MMATNTGKLKNRTKYILLAALALIFAACNNSKQEKECIKLVKFDIIDPLLDSLTHRMAYVHTQDVVEWDDLMCLEINKYEGNDSIEYAYLFCQPNYINWDLLRNKNMRILGYTTVDSLDVILFSNIDDFREMRDTVSQYIKVVDEYREFGFSYEYAPDYSILIDPYLGENFCYYYRCLNGKAVRSARWH